MIDQKENVSQQYPHQQQQQQPSSLSQFSLSQLPSMGQIPFGLTAPSGPAFPITSMHMGQIPQQHLFAPLVDMTPSLSQLPSSMMMPMGGAFTSYAPPIHQQLQQEMVTPKPMMVPPKASLPVFSGVEYNDDNSCVICYEDMIDYNSLRLECGHRFHKTVSHTCTIYVLYCTVLHCTYLYSVSIAIDVCKIMI